MHTLIGLFLIAHGLIHAGYVAPKPNDPKYPFVLDKSWFAHLVGDASRPIGITLAVATVILFTLAGLAVLGVPGLAAIWKPLIIAGSIASLLTLILFWHNWLIVGLLINIVLLYGLLKLGWQLR